MALTLVLLLDQDKEFFVCKFLSLAFSHHVGFGCCVQSFDKFQSWPFEVKRKKLKMFLDEKKIRKSNH